MTDEVFVFQLSGGLSRAIAEHASDDVTRGLVTDGKRFAILLPRGSLDIARTALGKLALRGRLVKERDDLVDAMRAAGESDEDAALRFRLGVWRDLEQRCEKAGLGCWTSPSESEAHIEGLVHVQIDHDSLRLTLNGRLVRKVDTYDEVWSECEGELARIRRAVLPPEKLEKLLVEIIESVASKSGGHRTAWSGVPLLEVLKEMKKRRGRGYNARLFAAELSSLTKGRHRIALMPVTLVREAISVYFKNDLGFRKIGVLAVRD